jgi:hypothetical protein
VVSCRYAHPFSGAALHQAADRLDNELRGIRLCAWRNVARFIVPGNHGRGTQVLVLGGLGLAQQEQALVAVEAARLGIAVLEQRHQRDHEPPMRQRG